MNVVSCRMMKEEEEARWVVEVYICTARPLARSLVPDERGTLRNWMIPGK